VVSGYLDHLTVERGLAANTISSYRRDLRRYTEFLDAAGVRGLGEVAESDVAGFLAALRQGDDDHPPLSATSAARAVVAVRGLHRFALLDGLVPDDVAHEVRPPAPARRLPKAIPVESVVALIEAAGSLEGPRGLRDRALLELLYGTGARISEAVGLAVDDLDRGQSVVRLAGKGGKQRIVPVGSYALRAVEDYLVRARPGLVAAGRGTPALFLNARGGRLSPATTVDELVAPSPYVPQRVYSTTKQANLLFATELARRAARAGSPVSAVAVHPGVSNTELFVRHLPGGRRSPLVPVVKAVGGLVLQSSQAGALPTLRGLDHTTPSGAFVGPGGLGQLRGRPVLHELPSTASDPATAERLWELTEQVLDTPLPL